MNLEEIIVESAETITSLRGLSEQFTAAGDLLVDCLKSGGKPLICGNGGSAADAMHFTTELVCRFEKERCHLPAICLNSSGPDITAMANDFAYEEIFARQLEAFATPCDLLIVISTSGLSSNVTRVLEAARSREIPSLALLGKNGGNCSGKATVELTVESESTARIQEAHAVLIHALCSVVDDAFA